MIDPMVKKFGRIIVRGPPNIHSTSLKSFLAEFFIVGIDFLIFCITIA
jgi:hypothetical protein